MPHGINTQITAFEAAGLPAISDWRGYGSRLPLHLPIVREFRFYMPEAHLAAILQAPGRAVSIIYTALVWAVTPAICGGRSGIKMRTLISYG